MSDEFEASVSQFKLTCSLGEFTVTVHRGSIRVSFGVEPYSGGHLCVDGQEYNGFINIPEASGRINFASWLLYESRFFYESKCTKNSSYTRGYYESTKTEYASLETKSKIISSIKESFEKNKKQINNAIQFCNISDLELKAQIRTKRINQLQEELCNLRIEDLVETKELNQYRSMKNDCLIVD